MKTEIKVLRPGFFTTVQDSERIGFAKYGVPKSGSMDRFSSAFANFLLQNEPSAAVLEMTLLGPELRFSAATQIAISGAFLSPVVNKVPVENDRILPISKGDILSFGKRSSGCRTYLAIKGGFQSEEVLGSRSWYPGITSCEKLEKGMSLTYLQPENRLSPKAAHVKPQKFWTGKELPAFPGPEFSMLPEEKKEELLNSIFTISSRNDRMGIQLQENFKNDLPGMLSSPVLPGTVQLTPSGKLIVLMRDAQTTGGYPRVLQLPETSINKIAQKVQGEKVRFRLRELQK